MFCNTSFSAFSENRNFLAYMCEVTEVVGCCKDPTADSSADLMLSSGFGHDCHFVAQFLPSVLLSTFNLSLIMLHDGYESVSTCRSAAPNLQGASLLLADFDQSTAFDYNLSFGDTDLGLAH